MTPQDLDADGPDGRAAEYVLGTLTAEERAAFARELAADPQLAEAVRGWEERLVPLAEGIAPVEPSGSLWDRILHGIGAAGAAEVVDFASAAEWARLRRSRSAWRAGAAAAAAIAASLVVVVARDRLAEPVAPRPGLVAVVNRSGELPALVVRVDPAAGVVQVRSLAAETPAGSSLELWSIVGTGAPHSLGTLAAGASRAAAIPTSDRPRLEGATLAVSVEPLGGSKTGGPTGPVVYSGKLVPE